MGSSKLNTKHSNHNNKIIITLANGNPSTLEKYHLLALGLSECNWDVTLMMLCHEKEEKKMLNGLRTGHREYTIDFGPAGPLYKGGNKLGKLIRVSRICLFFLLRMLPKIIQNRPTIILPRDSFEVITILVFLSKFFKLDIISHIMEYTPAMPEYRQVKRARISWEMLMVHSRAFIVISKYLQDTLSPLKPTFYLPILLNAEPHSEENNDHSDDTDSLLDLKINRTVPILLYTSGANYKETLHFTIEALSFVSLDYVCIITGSYPEKEKIRLSKLFQEKKLSDKVFFSGFLSDKTLLSLQRKSKALIMPLLKTTQDIARFPQKIASYICLKKPLVTTNVGEIKVHFKDGFTAFIDETCMPEGFASKITYVLKNQDTAEQVGRNAQQFVLHHFCYRAWTQKLSDYLIEEKNECFTHNKHHHPNI